MALQRRRKPRQVFASKPCQHLASVPTHRPVFVHALCPSKRRRTRPPENKNKNTAAVDARRRRRRNPDINYLEARRHETSSGRVRFERFTKFAKADIQMVLRKKKKEKKSQTGRREGLGYERCRVWIRIDRHRSEIAPFLGTSVYFASVALAFLHLTRRLHRPPTPPPPPRLSQTLQTPRGCRMFE